MMHLYSALLYIAVHPKRFRIMWGGGGGVSSQPPPVFSIHLDEIMLLCYLSYNNSPFFLPHSLKKTNNIFFCLVSICGTRVEVCGTE